MKESWPQGSAEWEAHLGSEARAHRDHPEELRRSVVPGYYTRPGIEVEVDHDAKSDNPTGPAIVTITDHERWLIYGVEAVEDEQGRARIISLGVGPMDDPDGESPYRYLDERPRRDEAWLARVAVEAWREASTIDAPLQDDELLRYVADVARKSAREGVSAADVLTRALRVSPRTVTRLRNRAVEAGLLDSHEPGRPRKSTPTPEESA